MEQVRLCNICGQPIRGRLQREAPGVPICWLSLRRAVTLPLDEAEKITRQRRFGYLRIRLLRRGLMGGYTPAAGYMVGRGQKRSGTPDLAAVGSDHGLERHHGYGSLASNPQDQPKHGIYRHFGSGAQKNIVDLRIIPNRLGVPSRGGQPGVSVY